MVQREIKLNRLSERMSLKFLPEFAGRESLICSDLFKRKFLDKAFRRHSLSALILNKWLRRSLRHLFLSPWKMLISVQRVPCIKN